MQAWQVAFVMNLDDERIKSFEEIKRICDFMGPEGAQRKKEYISRMKPPTRKTDTRHASTAGTKK